MSASPSSFDRNLVNATVCSSRFGAKFASLRINFLTFCDLPFRDSAFPPSSTCKREREKSLYFMWQVEFMDRGFGRTYLWRFYWRRRTSNVERAKDTLKIGTNCNNNWQHQTAFDLTSLLTTTTIGNIKQLWISKQQQQQLLATSTIIDKFLINITGARRLWVVLYPWLALQVKTIGLEPFRIGNNLCSRSFVCSYLPIQIM